MLIYGGAFLSSEVPNISQMLPKGTPKKNEKYSGGTSWSSGFRCILTPPPPTMAMNAGGERSLAPPDPVPGHSGPLLVTQEPV